MLPIYTTQSQILNSFNSDLSLHSNSAELTEEHRALSLNQSRLFEAPYSREQMEIFILAAKTSSKFQREVVQNIDGHVKSIYRASIVEKGKALDMSDNPILQKVLENATAQNAISFFRNIYGVREDEYLCLISLQLNHMKEGDVFTPHDHAERAFTGVLGINEAEKGGVHFTCDDEESYENQILHPFKRGEYLAATGKVIHGVTQVETGTRDVLVYEWDVSTTPLPQIFCF